MAGTEVGRIYIKVSPDTDGFREALSRQLKSETAGLKADVPADLKNTGKVEAELAKLSRDRKVVINADTSFAERSLLRLRESLDAVKASGKDTRLFEDAARGLERKIQSVPVSPELIPGWQEDIRAELARMQSLAVDINPSFGGGARLRAEMAAEMARLQMMANLRKIKVTAVVDVDRRSWRTTLASLRASALAASLTNMTTGATATIAKIGSSMADAGNRALDAVGGFRAFGIGLAGMLAIALLVPPALSLIAGALVTLPSLLAGLLVPIAAVALGFDGIKRAAENTGLFDPTGGKDGKGGVGKALDEIRAKVSDTFEQGLTPAFQGIADLMPTLTSSFQGVAQGLSDIAQQGVAGIQQKLPQVQNTISNIGRGLSNAAPGIRDFTAALIQLADGVAQKFPGLGTAFSNMMADFRGWADKFTMKDPISGVSQLDLVLGNLRVTANAIWGLLGQIAGVSLDNLSRADFGEGMKRFFSAVSDFVTNTLPALQSGFEQVAAILDNLSPLFKLIGLFSNGVGYIKDFDKTLAGTLNRMQETKDAGGGFWAQVGSGIFDVGDPGGPWRTLEQAQAESAKKAGTAGAQAYQAGIRESLTAGAPLDGSDQLLTGLTQGVAEAAKTQGQKVAEQFTQGLQEVAKGNVAGGMEGMQQAFSQPIQQGAQQAQIASGQMVTQVQGDTNAATQLLTAMASTAQTVSGQWTQITQAAVAGTQQAVAAVQAGTLQIVQTFSSGFGNLYNVTVSALSAVASATAAALTPALNVVATIATGMLQTMQAGLSAIPAVVDASFGPVPAVITAKMAEANGSVASGGQTIIATMLSFAGAARSAGVAIGAAFAEGLASQGELVASSARSLMDAAKQFFPSSPAETGPFSGRGWVTFSGESIGQGFADGINTSTSDVVSAAKAMMQAIKDVFGSAEGLTLNFNFGAFGGGGYGGSAFSGLQSTMSGAAASARDFQTAMNDSIAPSRQLTADDKERIKDLSQQLLQLEMRRKELELMRATDKNNPAIKSELEQIKNAKLALGLEKDKLTYAQKYNGSVSDTTQQYADYVKTAASMPLDFATTTAQQTMSDFGMSGGGVLGAGLSWASQLAGNALGVGSNFIFNVNSVEEALAMRDNTVAKQGMGVLPR